MMKKKRSIIRKNRATFNRVVKEAVAVRQDPMVRAISGRLRYLSLLLLLPGQFWQDQSSESQTPRRSRNKIPLPQSNLWAYRMFQRDENVPIKASPALWRPGLDSMASLGKVAADTDAVFILLAADNQESNQTAIKQVEAAAQTIQSNGIRIAAFRLSQGAPNYANLTEQLSAPCVLALVKGGSVSGVSADQITESKLVQAYVAASRPSSGCCGPGASCGP